MPFTKKPLLPTNRICLRLKQAREVAGVSLDTIATKTKIGRDYLAAIEECRFAELKCAPLYQKNFVKKYVEALGLDPEPFISQFYIEELNPSDAIALRPQTNYRRNHFGNLPNIIRYSAIGLTALSLVFYLGKQVKNTIEPPTLSLSTPADGYIADTNAITIAGATEPEVKIAINGEHIRSDDRGHFSQALTLSPGINTIVVTAEKKHGKTTEETRHIIFKETPKFTLNER